MERERWREMGVGEGPGSLGRARTKVLGGSSAAKLQTTQLGCASDTGLPREGLESCAPATHGSESMSSRHFLDLGSGLQLRYSRSKVQHGPGHGSNEQDS